MAEYIQTAVEQAKTAVINGAPGAAAALGAAATVGAEAVGAAALGAGVGLAFVGGMKAAGMEYTPVAGGVSTAGAWVPTKDGFCTQAALTVTTMGVSGVQFMIDKALEFVHGATSVVYDALNLDMFKLAFEKVHPEESTFTVGEDFVFSSSCIDALHYIGTTRYLKVEDGWTSGGNRVLLVPDNPLIFYENIGSGNYKAHVFTGGNAISRTTYGNASWNVAKSIWDFTGIFSFNYDWIYKFPFSYKAPANPPATFPNTRVTLPPITPAATPEETYQNALGALNGAERAAVVSDAGATTADPPIGVGPDVWNGSQAWQEVCDLVWNCMGLIQDYLPDVYLSQQLEVLMGLSQALSGVNSLTEYQYGILCPPLVRLRERLRTGSLTQTGTQTATQEIETAREQVFPKEGAGTESPDPAVAFHLFPFCIPFDVVNMIKSLRETPEAPCWEIPLAIPSSLKSVYGKPEETIVLDLSFLEPIMPFVRMMILLMFVIGLAKATSGFIKW